MLQGFSALGMTVPDEVGSIGIALKSIGGIARVFPHAAQVVAGTAVDPMLLTRGMMWERLCARRSRFGECHSRQSRRV